MNGFFIFLDIILELVKAAIEAVFLYLLFTISLIAIVVTLILYVIQRYRK